MARHCGNYCMHTLLIATRLLLDFTPQKVKLTFSILQPGTPFASPQVILNIFFKSGGRQQEFNLNEVPREANSSLHFTFH